MNAIRSSISPKRPIGDGLIRSSLLALCLIAGSVVLSQPHTLVLASVKPQRSNTITGRIVGDDGQPVPEASVSLALAGGNNAPSINRSTATDDGGFFHFSALPSGDYYIWVNALGYLSDTFNAGERKEGGRTYFHPSDSVTLTLKKGGVITGKVVNSKNEPVIGAFVGAIWVRDHFDRLLQPRSIHKRAEVQTDDRGVYRLFGLTPGGYLIVVNGRPILPSRQTSSYDGDAPTYYPSATRAEASEVVIRGHEEASGIDIQYRSEQGWQISGSVKNSAAAKTGNSTYLKLTQAATGIPITEIYADAASRFSFVGLPDGDYVLTATQGGGREEEGAASSPITVTVRGADVEGVEVTLTPFSSITGSFVTSPLPTPRPSACRQTSAPRLGDIRLEAYSQLRVPWSSQSSVNNAGGFKLLKIVSGNYRLLATNLPGAWYLQAMTLAPTAATQPPQDVTRAGLTLKSGEHLQGVTITLAEGAASVRGQIRADKEGARLPTYLRVHLIPAEREEADNVLRFAETFTRDNGEFSLTNLVPGRYWIIVRSASEAETVDLESRPAAWDAESRATLRREAQSSKIEIELQPCQSTGNYTLRYAPVSK